VLIEGQPIEKFQFKTLSVDYLWQSLSTSPAHHIPVIFSLLLYLGLGKHHRIWHTFLSYHSCLEATRGSVAREVDYLFMDAQPHMESSPVKITRAVHMPCTSDTKTQKSANFYRASDKKMSSSSYLYTSHFSCGRLDMRSGGSSMMEKVPLYWSIWGMWAWMK